LTERGRCGLKLIEALEILKKPVPEDARALRIALACGFTPLHLETFLAAHLRSMFPDRAIDIRTGLFGDLQGNLERLDPAGLDALAVVLEWPDLDLRLGMRNLGGWRIADLPDILDTAAGRTARLERSLKSLSGTLPVAISLPTLPLPPLFFTRSRQASTHELRLRSALGASAVSLSSEPGVRILNAQLLDRVSPPSDRYDLRSDIATGFPYRNSHASRVAGLMAGMILDPVPKKGLITDLDDTLWSGILGEVGVEALAWSLDRQAHLNGLYQQFLASLASAGVLIGVASKNDPGLVEQAFARRDFLLRKGDVFPFEVHWDRKSGSVRRILETWNIGPDAAVFVDDSPMEVAEVQAAFPGLCGIVFPKNDPAAFWSMLEDLRDLFGKKSVSAEDSLRLQSIRGASELRALEAGSSGSLDDFLRTAEARVRFIFGTRRVDPRALELINKTNQFNLNGVKFGDAAWRGLLEDPEAFLLVVDYEDKFGPLGKIAVIAGRRTGPALSVEAWAMSCRAFSRRIEHQCLKYLFAKTAADEIALDYRETPRNGPFRSFLLQWAEAPLSGGVRIPKEVFAARVPALFHAVEEDVLE